MAPTLPPAALVHKAFFPRAGEGNLHPTVILLHGRGTDEDDLLGLASYLDPRLLVISARAPFRFPFGGWMWYDIQEVGTPHPQQFAESYDRLIQFLSEVRQHYPADPQRVFLLGFSMGSVMSFAVGLTRPDEVAGVVAHSGYIAENTHLEFRWQDIRKTGFFVAHGKHDPVIPLHFGRRAHELLLRHGADVVYREYPIAHQISEESLSDLAAWIGSRIDAHAAST